MEEKKGKNKYILYVLILILVVGGLVLFDHYQDRKTEERTVDKTTKIGFEDIGELATQVAYCTQVHSFNENREVLGLNVPFTKSSYIYSYDVEIKAGINFSEVKYKIDEKKRKIIIDMPKAKVLSCELDYESFKVYHEEESIFTNISLKEMNEGLDELTEEAKKNAVDNGFLDKANENAKETLKAFFPKGEYGDYEFEFKTK